MAWIVLILRWFHLVAAMTVVGGTIFMRLSLVPSVAVLGDEQRKQLHQQVRSRWAKLVAVSIAFLLISGFINFFIFYQASKTPEWAAWREKYNGLYQAIFGVKFLLAMVIFFVASALAGRSKAMEGIRRNAKWWMTLNLILALTVVALSGVLRMTHVGPTLPAVAETPNTGTSGGGNG